MVKLNDLSRYLGLSKTQVSRALNGYSDVSAETRSRVEAAARELGYRPNPLARKLRSGRSGIVGLVLSEGSEQEEANILVEILLGLAVAFRSRDMLVVLNVMPIDCPVAEAYARLSREGRLDGFVVLNPGVEAEGIGYLEEARVPFVTHGRHADAARYPYVDIDNRGAGHMMGAHLAALGHRDIAVIDGPAGLHFARERELGVRLALGEHGVELRANRISHGLMTETFGAMATRRLMADPSSRPTAIVAGNFVVAAGIVGALGELGLSIPGDVSVMAHDDDLSLYPAPRFSPLLTGSRCPFPAAYDLLADHLDRAIAGADPASLQSVMTPTFTNGGSTAARPDVSS